MSYVGTTELFAQAQKSGRAVGAFNVENAEMAQAVIAAAQERNAPVILQTTSSTLRYLPPVCFAGIVKALAQEAAIPVALHLDHGNSLELVKRCLEAGYTSVMYDGSALPLQENIKNTRKAVALAKSIPVEGELGKIGGKEDDIQAEACAYTDPIQACEFCAETGVGSLAIAVGTAHGFYAETPRLNLALAAQIKNLLPVPTVLHGASGLEDAVIRQAVLSGFSKINFATELRWAFTAAVRASLTENPAAADPKIYLAAGKAAVKDLVTHKLSLCGF